MKYFVAMEENIIQELWAHDPSLVVPLSHPIYPGEFSHDQVNVDREARTLIPLPDDDSGNC